jgi:hypothetical protein
MTPIRDGEDGRLVWLACGCERRTARPQPGTRRIRCRVCHRHTDLTVNPHTRCDGWFMASVTLTERQPA